MLSRIHLNEALRIFLSSYKRKINGVRKYKGSALQICRKIISDCWNGKYFMTSAGHFSEFWTRDFGWCSSALCRQGYIKKVSASLSYALDKFSKCGKVTTTISPDGVCFDVMGYSVDSLPWLVRSIKNSLDKKIIKKYKRFIELQASIFTKRVIDLKTSLVKKTPFSSIKDFAVRKSSTYDNVMAAMLKEDLTALKLKNPLKNLDIEGSILYSLWNGSYFKNDLEDDSITSDANIFPFITGVFLYVILLQIKITYNSIHTLGWGRATRDI